MVKGNISVLLYKGDRTLWDAHSVLLTLLDPFSDDGPRAILRTESVSSGPSFLLKDVPAERGQPYALIAYANGYRQAGIYPVIPIPNGVVHASLMLVPDDPTPDFSTFSYPHLDAYAPTFRAALEAGGVDESAFSRVDAITRAETLNLEAKLRSTLLAGTPAIEFVQRVRGPEALFQDRFYVQVKPNMPGQVRAEIAQQKTFRELQPWENEIFHKGYPISFKQSVPFGSLQLSFAPASGDDGRLDADIDIDLFTDVGHWGEVARNMITGHETDPYTVYVQLFDQRIFPLYLLR
jgi:hypothetical protein